MSLNESKKPIENQQSIPSEATFSFSLLPPDLIESFETVEGRYYKTPGGDFPSVTNVIGKAFGTEKLDQWRQRVGNYSADKVMRAAQDRGNAVHMMFEKYIGGQKDWEEKQTIPNLDLFYKAKNFVDNNLSMVYGLELPLYSSTLKAAGKTDLIGRWGNQYNAITDFKTSSRKLSKSDDRLLKYRLQATAYAMMVEERYGLDVPFSMLIILTKDGSPQIDIKRNNKYRSVVQTIFGRYSKWEK